VDALVALVVLVLLVAVVWVIAGPLRAGEAVERDELSARRAELEAAKEAKYREIRDAELDHGTGKLDDADWRAVDRQLRAEAVELLRALDALGEPDDR
jgi:type II secretory pathway component PulM